MFQKGRSSLSSIGTSLVLSEEHLVHVPSKLKLLGKGVQELKLISSPHSDTCPQSLQIKTFMLGVNSVISQLP